MSRQFRQHCAMHVHKKFQPKSVKFLCSKTSSWWLLLTGTDGRAGMVTLTLDNGEEELSIEQRKQLFDHCSSKLPKYMSCAHDLDCEKILSERGLRVLHCLFIFSHKCLYIFFTGTQCLCSRECARRWTSLVHSNKWRENLSMTALTQMKYQTNYILRTRLPKATCHWLQMSTTGFLSESQNCREVVLHYDWMHSSHPEKMLLCCRPSLKNRKKKKEKLRLVLLCVQRVFLNLSNRISRITNDKKWKKLAWRKT